MPRVFIAPQRYVQGRGVLGGIGRYLSLMHGEARCAADVGARKPERGRAARWTACAPRASSPSSAIFRGECSLEEITAHVEALANERIDCVIAAGGGKCIDAGKGVAFRLGTPVVIVPTLASNDAPCSALSVLYSPEGVSTGVEFYPQSPAFVVVDTDIIAAAPERYLVAGMGDAMATWYEARVCLLNPAAVTAVGARPTLASCAIGEVCAQTLFEKGAAAARGGGGEHRERRARGGRRGEHVAERARLRERRPRRRARRGPELHRAFPKVQRGLSARRDGGDGHARPADDGVASRRGGQGRRVLRDGRVCRSTSASCRSMPTTTSALDVVAEGTLAFPFIGNMPQPVTAALVRAAVLDAHRLGLSIGEKCGDTAYRRLRAS